MIYSGGEIRMNKEPLGVSWPKLDQGTPVGYRLVVVNRDDHRFGAEAKAEAMQPLLDLNEQFAELGYEFVKLERIFGG
jgi:hypothetical protein